MLVECLWLYGWQFLKKFRNRPIPYTEVRQHAGAVETFCAGDVSALAIDDKFEDDISNLIDSGKEKGYLTYGDVNDMLPDDMHNADDLDDLITTHWHPGH